MRLFTAKEVSLSHVRHVALVLFGPRLHSWRPLGLLLCHLLYRFGASSVRIAFSEDRIDCTSQNLGIAGFYLFFFVSARVLFIVRNLKHF